MDILSAFTCTLTLLNFSMKEKTHFILTDVVPFPACKLRISLTILMSLLCLLSLPHTAFYTTQHLWLMLTGSAFSVGGFTQNIPMLQRGFLWVQQLSCLSLWKGAISIIYVTYWNFRGKKRSSVMVFMLGIWFSGRLYNHSFCNMVYQKLYCKSTWIFKEAATERPNTEEFLLLRRSTITCSVSP